MAGWWISPDTPVSSTKKTDRKSLTYFITWCCIEYTSPLARFKLTTLVVNGSYCICSWKSNYHTITITTTTAIVPLSGEVLNFQAENIYNMCIPGCHLGVHLCNMLYAYDDISLTLNIEMIIFCRFMYDWFGLWTWSYVLRWFLWVSHRIHRIWL